MKLKSNKGFTLIELLVVIVIIGILATLATVALGAAKVKARDAKRISDIKQMQTALELYYNEESTYPPTTALAAGQALVGAVSGKTFMGKIPAGPSSGETYTYNQINGGTSYTLGYVLEKPVNEFAAGAAVALPGSINNQCTPNCGGKNCGPNGCGGICGTACTGSTPICKSDFSACVGCNTNSDCPGGTPYCNVNTCSASKPTPCSDAAAAAAECTTSNAYGAICGGGYLVCKTGDANSNDCGNINLVVAPSNCTNSTTCSCGTDNLAKAWDFTASPSQLNLNNAVDGRLNFSDGADGGSYPAKNNTNANYAAAKFCLDLNVNGFSDWYLPAAKELAAIVKSSEPFYSYSSKSSSNAYYGENTTNATLQSATTHYTTTSLITASADSRVSGLASTYYWSSTEYSATTAWYQIANSGSQDGYSKTTALYVRCVRRF